MPPRFRVTTAEARQIRGITKGRKGKYNAAGLNLHRLTGEAVDKDHPERAWFASAAEGIRFLQLLELQKTGAIERLELQPVYACIVNGQPVCKYRADFRYLVLDERGRSQYLVVEDVKGMLTDAYVLKKKLVEALHGVDVNEIPASKVKQWAGRTP